MNEPKRTGMQKRKRTMAYDEGYETTGNARSMFPGPITTARAKASLNMEAHACDPLSSITSDIERLCERLEQVHYRALAHGDRLFGCQLEPPPPSTDRGEPSGMIDELRSAVARASDLLDLVEASVERACFTELRVERAHALKMWRD